MNRRSDFVFLKFHFRKTPDLKITKLKIVDPSQLCMFQNQIHENKIFYMLVNLPVKQRLNFYPYSLDRRSKEKISSQQTLTVFFILSVFLTRTGKLI